MKEMPFAAFLLAWLRPRIWLRIFSETASPDASSPARLMAKPEESFSMFLAVASFVSRSDLSANIALRLWLMIMIILLECVAGHPCPGFPVRKPPFRLPGRESASYRINLPARSPKRLLSCREFRFAGPSADEKTHVASPASDNHRKG